MKNILGYIRGIIGLREEENSSSCTKRDREPDDDPPVMKKYKTVSNHFPKIAMPSDEDEWTVPKRVNRVPHTRYIPITREEPFPSTSTPTTRLFDKVSGKPHEMYDIGKDPEPSSSSSQWNQAIFSSQRASKQNTGPLRSSFDPISKVNTLPKLAHTSREELVKRATIEKEYQERFMNLSPSHVTRFHNAQNEAEDNAFNYENSNMLKERRFFKSKKSPIEDKTSDIIEVSDSEDYDLILLKRPKSVIKTHEHYGHSSHNYKDAFDDDIPDEQPCAKCKPRQSHPGQGFQRSLSPRSNRQSFARFKTPLSLSKAMRINSITPFWKSRTDRGDGTKLFKSKLPYVSRGLVDKCIRLEEKKRYSDLIRLASTGSFGNKLSSKPSHVQLSEIEQRIKQVSKQLNRPLVSRQNNDLDEEPKLQNGTIDIDSPEEPAATVVLSDSDTDQVVSADDASTSSSTRVAPVNSLRQSFQEKGILDSKWIEDLNKKYQNIQLEKKHEEKDCIILSTTQSKTNRDFWLKKKQHDIKSLVYDLTDDTDEVEEISLPELTDEQQAIINNALRPNPPNQVLIEKFNLSIHRRDIQTLAGLNWLNDEVINFYMNLLMERGQQNKDLPKVYGMNTFFYPKLMQSGHAGLKRWTRKVDIFSHDLMFVPVHLGVHWCMSIIDFRNKTIKYYDSMGGKNMPCCDALLRYLAEEKIDKKKESLDTTGWERECVKDIPQQMNGSDCGMFSCTFAEFVSRDAPISFSQSDMPYLRRKMILEIVSGKLLM